MTDYLSTVMSLSRKSLRYASAVGYLRGLQANIIQKKIYMASDYWKGVTMLAILRYAYRRVRHEHRTLNC